MTETLKRYWYSPAIFMVALFLITVGIIDATHAQANTAEIETIAITDPIGIDLPTTEIPSYAPFIPVTLEDVPTGTGGIVDVEAKIFTDEEDLSKVKKAWLSVNGFAITAQTWERFAVEDHVENLIAFDFAGRGETGRGESGLPSVGQMGQLGMHDDVVLLQNVAERFRETYGIKIEVVIAHSRGASTAAGVQDDLLKTGSSMKKALKIKEVVFVAPAPPGDNNLLDDLLEILWHFVLFADFIRPSVTLDPHPVFGDRVGFSDESWLGDYSGPNAPTLQEVADRGYNTPEPGRGADELIGSNGVTRFSVSPGVFAQKHGTRLRVIAFRYDQAVPGEFDFTGEGDPDRISEQVYQWYTGDDSLACFTEIDHEYATHGMLFTDPNVVVDAIDSLKTCHYK